MSKWWYLLLLCPLIPGCIIYLLGGGVEGVLGWYGMDLFSASFMVAAYVLGR